MPSGGDCKEITWKNVDAPNGGGRLFSKGGESHTLMLDGFSESDDATDIDTGGNLIFLKTTVPGSYEATVVNDQLNPNRMELESLAAMTNSFNPTTFTFACVDGCVYTGVGKVTGQPAVDRSKATISFKCLIVGVQQVV